MCVEVWLSTRPERASDPATVTAVLSSIRYPLMAVPQLYAVDTDPLVGPAPGAPGTVRALVDQAIRYRAFQGCVGAAGRDEWTGAQFEKRVAP